MNIDMHCHLDLYREPFKVAAECKAKGTYVLSVTTTPKAWAGTCKLAEGSHRIRTALGLHPQLAHQRAHEIELFDTLLSSAKYIGEIGLDGSRDFNRHMDVQLKVFRHILRSVRNAGGRIMSIHSRSSAGQVLQELEGMPGAFILHWFTGTHRDLKRAIDMGCWFSINPKMLNTKKGVELVSMIPAERVFTETDGPFATLKEKVLFPWETNLLIPVLAKMWNSSEDWAQQRINENLKTLCTNA